jgi:hypothetical protein
LIFHFHQIHFYLLEFYHDYKKAWSYINENYRFIYFRDYQFNQLSVSKVFYHYRKLLNKLVSYWNLILVLMHFLYYHIIIRWSVFQFYFVCIKQEFQKYHKLLVWFNTKEIIFNLLLYNYLLLFDGISF